MIHGESSELAGKTVKIKQQITKFGGAEYRVEDWWDRVSGGSWMFAIGNPACIEFAVRTGLVDASPTDDEVLYGKIGSFGHLFHISELDIE